MARLWARTVTFEAVAVGDQLPILVKWETADTIARFAALLSPVDDPDEADPPKGQESLTVSQAPAPALLGYITELLEKAFPVASILASGSRVEMEALAPVRPGDTIALSGRVVDKREEEGRRVVQCEITMENQDNRTVARAAARVCL